MNKTFKKILSVCCTVVTTLTATLFRSTDVYARNLYKIVFIGDENVGKTQLVSRIARDGFSDDYECTVMPDFFTRNTTRDDQAQIWDNPGQTRKRDYATPYYRGLDVLLYCCSCEQIDSQSRENLQQSFGIPATSPVMLCITKTDELQQSDQYDINACTPNRLMTAMKAFREANEGCNILSEILVTSAKTGQYKLCTPENYDSADYKNIHPNLAEDLVTLCNGPMPDRSNVNDETGQILQSPVDKKIQSDRIDSTNTAELSKGKNKWLWIPTLFAGMGMIGGLALCVYDRHQKRINSQLHKKQKLSKRQLSIAA